MAPIKIKDVVTFSSEDPRFPAQNLLKGQKWLTNSADNVGKATIEFQLEKASRIHYIDIGHHNVASMSVMVGRSSWSSSQEYAVLLPTVVLQTPQEARAGKNKTGCKMYKYPEHFSAEHVRERWDRIRIMLNQPFVKKQQIGLEFVRFASPRNELTAAVKAESPTTFSQKGAWRTSSIGRLANSMMAEGAKVNELEERLLRISSTTEDGSGEKNSLSRTAKMVLSSRITHESPQPRKNPTAHTPPSNMKPKGTLCGLVNPITSPPSPHMRPTPTRLREASTESIRIKKHKPVPPHRDGTTNSLYSPQVTKSVCNNSPMQYKFKRTKSTGCSPCTSGSSGTWDTSNISDIPCTSGTPTTSKTSVPHATDTATLDDGGEFSREKIKKTKKLIQKFFNTLDMEQTDPHNISLEELQMTFEALSDVKLDTNGREYFERVAMSFMELAMMCRRHKGIESEVTEAHSDTVLNGPFVRKRKSSERAETASASDLIETCRSPAKVRRKSRHNSNSGGNADCEIISVTDTPTLVECPLCMEMFPQEIISDHAAVCGEDDAIEVVGNTATVNEDVQITSVFNPQRQVHTLRGETVLDLSDNMRLTDEEKKYWINFSKQPKPFHPRMGKDLFNGAKLIKCPTCGQSYRVEDIQEHSDDCAEKVNSGFERRGLYYVKKSTGKIVKNV